MKWSHDEKGVILLPVTIMVVFLYLIIGLGCNLALNNYKMNQINRDAVELFYYSETGLNSSYKALADEINIAIDTANMSENGGGIHGFSSAYFSHLSNYINNNMAEGSLVFANSIVEDATLSIEIVGPTWVDKNRVELKVISKCSKDTYTKELSQRFSLYIPNSIDEVDNLDVLLQRYEWK